MFCVVHQSTGVNKQQDRIKGRLVDGNAAHPRPDAMPSMPMLMLILIQYKYSRKSARFGGAHAGVVLSTFYFVTLRRNTIYVLYLLLWLLRAGRGLSWKYDATMDNGRSGPFQTNQNKVSIDMFMFFFFFFDIP